MGKSAIEVDLKGLAKLLERKGVEWVALELLQNAWDTETEAVNIEMEKMAGRPYVTLKVEDDDPDGFKNLAHAWTMFAESYKKSNPEQRGRFNIGEKLVLAYALAHNGWVRISTTTGTVVFDRNGRRVQRKKCTPKGSLVVCHLKMNHEQYQATLDALKRTICPVGLTTLLNGEPLPQRHSLYTVDVKLPTEVADEEGVLRRRIRKTQVRVYEVADGEQASIYEMGIPVVETGDRFHYDVGQKVPLNMERDNVPPSYLKTLRVNVLNHAHEILDTKEATDDWVTEATGDPRCGDGAVDDVMGKRFGDRRVAFDPSDHEANDLARMKGYTLVHGGSLSRGQWENVKRSSAIKPAGQVTPSPKAYDPDGEPEHIVPESTWTPQMGVVVEHAKKIARATIDKRITVVIVKEPGAWWSANFGGSRLCLNVGKLSPAWWHDTVEIDSLLIHELAHAWESNHYSAAYHKALCTIGAKLADMYRRKAAECRRKVPS
jgi:hypothetical protein